VLQWDGSGEASLGGFPGQVLVKPKSKIAWDDSEVLFKLLGGHGKARIFASGREVVEHPLAYRFKDELVFQEYLPGDDRSLWSFHGFADERGSLLAWFIGRKLRTFPALTGTSTYLELAHEVDLAAVGRDIVARVPLRGVFKIDFKKDPKSGVFRVLEINARFNLWHHLAARNGLNLPKVAYDYLMHGTRPQTPLSYGTGVRWICLPLDVRAYRELASRGELGAASWFASVLAHRKAYDSFAWTDPLPPLRALAGKVSSRLWRTITSFRWRPWRSTA
jgi:predicted ATP-grasp superfamily ATP-dependent carboligase